ncbi:MAG: hypothetical protein GPJ51_11255 [Candidatus Heimdallarchaeota archaeon]|nr:hypothetical protein [Candidatus Heimdallarchaeota archaeon]
MNKKVKVFLLFSIIVLLFVPNLVRGLEYSDFKAGKIYYWKISILDTTPLSIKSGTSLVENKIFRAKIVEVEKNSDGTVTNLIIKPKYMFPKEELEQYSHFSYCKTFLDKTFYLLGIIFIPKNMYSRDYISAMLMFGYEVTLVGTDVIFTYTKPDRVLFLKYDENGVLIEHIVVKDKRVIKVERVVNYDLVIGLSVTGIVIICGLTALTIVLLNRRKTKIVT